MVVKNSRGTADLYSQLNDRNSYLAFASGWEKVSKIAEYGDEDDVHNSFVAICQISKRYNIKIPPGIFSLYDCYEFLYFGEHCEKEVFTEISEILNATYIKCLCNFLDIYLSQINESLKIAGLDDEGIKNFYDYYFNE